MPTSGVSRNGAALIAPAFEEWMMGLPEGHVTDPAIWVGMKPGPARKAQLKALGNGVVPQQADLAVSTLLKYVPAWVLDRLRSEAVAA